ncbi:MAG: hypothetical protein M1503_07380 [Thaumarchaeota archaeon]|nr:hypothetical protein [Nitrososphaerota archaeon]MCL5318063.1 hypothetical protein [Nitrososphaerota archaeon]
MDERIACVNCHRVFTPKWKQRIGILSDEEYAVCPYCKKENIFEIEGEEDEEEEEETEEEDDY